MSVCFCLSIVWCPLAGAAVVAHPLVQKKCVCVCVCAVLLCVNKVVVCVVCGVVCLRVCVVAVLCIACALYVCVHARVLFLFAVCFAWCVLHFVTVSAAECGICVDVSVCTVQYDGVCVSVCMCVLGAVLFLLLLRDLVAWHCGCVCALESLFRCHRCCAEFVLCVTQGFSGRGLRT